ncbi:retrovirus-related pol polyprotein from transposon TNT 1-94 [Tanacetum coccineum]
MKRLAIEEFPQREKREVATSNADIIEYYIEGVTTIKSYIDSAFRSTRTNEAYLFFQNEYVVLNYAPGTMNDRVVNGPLYIPNGFHSLVGTPFAAYGIDVAFGCHGGDDESFIFFGSTKFEKWVDVEGEKRHLNFNPQSHPQREIRIQRPVAYYRDNNNNTMKRLTIEEFPQREKREVATSNVDIIEYYIEGMNTIKSYIDSAFRSTRTNEAYLFFQNEYVALNYAPGTMNDRVVNDPLYIPNGFHSLVGTPFAAYGIDTAFGCHGGDDESFIFFGSICATINYALGTTNDKILEGPKTIN